MDKYRARSNPVKWIETGFYVVYLAAVFIAGFLLIISATGGSERWLFGIMALVLGAGDAFHLASRIYALWDKRKQDHILLLGIGKLITSLTMTVFYVILWNIGVVHYRGALFEYMNFEYINTLIYALAAIRVVLCLLPQNGWASAGPPQKWAIRRNIPFIILGLFVMLLFAFGSWADSDGLKFLWLAILLSFIFYIPVVMFSERNPKVGILMFPKSCAYIAIVLMGFTLPVV